MKLGVVGYGSRMQTVFKEIVRLEPTAQLAAITGIRNEQTKGTLDVKGIGPVPYYDNPEHMMQDVELDGVLIGTRCSLHTEMALKVLDRGIPLFLEKPVATNMEDFHRLKEGYARSKSDVVVSFPLRLTPLVQLAKEIVESGKLGTIEHVQAVNNVPYGGVYFQHWYRDENETGGLFLQKANHDLDYIQYLLDSRPVLVSAMTSKQIFKGEKPANLQCVDCEDLDECPESAVLKRKRREHPPGEYCAFAVDTGNEDSGSAIIQYESGMHVNYSQNFFVRNEGGARGARLMGYKGTMEFDFYTNQLKVYMHHVNRVETYDVNLGTDGHSGGDSALAQNFIDVVRGDAPSLSPMESGLLSALICLKARESARTHTFQSVEWDR